MGTNDDLQTLAAAAETNHIQVLNNLVPSSKDGKVLAPAVVSLFNSYKEQLSTTFQTVQDEPNQFKTDLSAIVSSQAEEIKSLKQEVKTLNIRIDKLENYADDSDAYERRDCVIFSGPSVPSFSPGENTAALLQSLVNQKLNVPLTPNDVSTVHRLGRRANSNLPDSSSIIVKLCRRDKKVKL